MKSFCISLEKKKNTWSDLDLYFSQNGIENVNFFPAVNGKEIGEYYKKNDTPISNPTLNLIKSLGGVEKIVSTWGLYHLENKKSRKDHAQLTSWGAVGCSLSHILLWKELVDKNLDAMLIFEDDVNFFDNFKDTLPVILENIPEDADAVFLSISRNFKGVRYNDLFDRVLDQFFGTHAYIMTNRGAKKVLPYVFPIEIQIDSFLGFRASISNLTLYTARDLCNQKMHSSSVQTMALCSLCEFNDNQIKHLNHTFGYMFIISILLVLIIFICVWKTI